VIKVFCLILLICAFSLDSPHNIFYGLIEIIKAPDILLTDYIAVGGVGAAFFNASMMGFINILLLKRFKSEITGLSFAALLTVIGFSFIGKNIFNFWPIYVGGYLYAKLKSIKFNTIILQLMFATTLAPIVSEMMFGTYLPVPFGFILGVSLGIIVGFVIVPISETIFKSHEGYTLYNVGLSGGLLGTMIFSVLRSFDLIIQTQDILSTAYHSFIIIFITLFSLSLIIVGFLFEKGSLKEYMHLLKRTGQSPSDFLNDYKLGTTYINMGCMGIVSVLFVYLSGGVFNGPIIAGILTVVGFSAFGKHPLNVIPVLVGVSLASYLKVWEASSTVVLIGGLFGTTLAPITGEFGILAGILAGFLHLSMVMNIGVIHGGTNLYNNGFAGGIVSIILVSVLKNLSNKDYDNA
ncbi:MAG TPA: DUF1576 domain-containing protein, partial [Erysipelothrix sp.]|nr:DUF1576 domain-containing protein [Erysipelothrix sp.]